MKSINIGKIIIKMNIKQASYLFQSIFLIGIGIYLLLTQQKDMVGAVGMEGVLGYIVTVISVLYFNLIASNLVMTVTMTEKTSKRMEYYLANGIRIQDLFKGYSIGCFVLSILPTLVILVATIIIFKEKNIMPIIIYIVSIYPIYCISYIVLLNMIILTVKNLSLVRNILFVLNFALLAGSSYVLNNIINIFIEHSISISGGLNLCVLVISGILLLIVAMNYKKLSNDTIVQSVND